MERGEVPDFSYVVVLVMRSRQGGKENIYNIAPSLGWAQKQAEWAYHTYASPQ